MTTTRTTFRFARFGLIGLLLCAGLLIKSAQPAAAAEIVATPVSAMPVQVQGAGHSDLEPAPVAPHTTPDLCPTGMAGFGWG
jgi:hypothetical protein